MRALLLIILLATVFVLPLWAKTYSCRDSNGRLHFSDNLQGLPEECLGKEKVVKPEPVDNLQYVPDTPVSRDVERKFQQNVNEVERKLAQKESVANRLQVNASALLKRHQQIREEMSRARRVWDNSSRQKLKQLKEDLSQVRLEKQQLLDELAKERLGTKERKAVENILGEISAE